MHLHSEPFPTGCCKALTTPRMRSSAHSGIKHGYSVALTSGWAASEDTRRCASLEVVQHRDNTADRTCREHINTRIVSALQRPEDEYDTVRGEECHTTEPKSC